MYIRVKCFLVGWRWYQMRIFNINNLRQCFRFEIFNSKSDCWKVFTSKENHIYAPWHLNLISYTFGTNFLRSMITCCDILLKYFMISTIGRGNISKLLCHCTIYLFSNWWKFQFFKSKIQTDFLSINFIIIVILSLYSLLQKNNLALKTTQLYQSIKRIKWKMLLKLFVVLAVLYNSWKTSDLFMKLGIF